MKLLASSICWCGRTEVEIPVSWVSDGQTSSCGPGCCPGCELTETDAFEDPYEEDGATVTPANQRKWKMSKFSPARYRPSDDSTEGLPARPDAVSLLIGVGLCACGCGDHVRGKKAKFCMGHDARLKGTLTRAHAAGVAIALYEETTGTAEVVDALTYAGRFSSDKVDWADLVREGAAKITERRGAVDRHAAERKVLERAAKDGAVRVGRWDATGSAAAIYTRPEGGYIVEYVDELGRIRQAEVAA